jgi:hypothetical protein
MRAGISESTRPAAAKELDRPQIINNRPLAVSLPRPDEGSRVCGNTLSTKSVIGKSEVALTADVDIDVDSRICMKVFGPNVSWLSAPRVSDAPINPL